MRRSETRSSGPSRTVVTGVSVPGVPRCASTYHRRPARILRYRVLEAQCSMLEALPCGGLSFHSTLHGQRVAKAAVSK
jgi:hypothetical protein